MKKYIPFIIIVVLLFVIIFRECGSSKAIPDNSKHIKDSIQLHQYKVENEVLILKSLAKTQSDTIYKDRHHYHEVRRDSLIPCEVKLVLCDTIIVHDSIHDITQELIIVKQDSVIKDLKSLRSIDSVSIKSLTKQVKRERNKKRLWQVLAGTATALSIAEQSFR